MAWLDAFWSDEFGAVLSSEIVLVATLGVIGATVGLHMAAVAVNEEFKELSFSIRSLDQSYGYAGFTSGRAYFAGSSYEQPDVEESLADLAALEAERENASGHNEGEADRPLPGIDEDSRPQGGSGNISGGRPNDG